MASELSLEWERLLTPLSKLIRDPWGQFPGFTMALETGRAKLLLLPWVPITSLQEKPHIYTQLAHTVTLSQTHTFTPTTFTSHIRTHRLTHTLAHALTLTQPLTHRPINLNPHRREKGSVPSLIPRESSGIFPGHPNPKGEGSLSSDGRKQKQGHDHVTALCKSAGLREVPTPPTPFH